MVKNIFKKIIVFILQIEARLILKKYKPKIVAVTGSVGKTSTKDAIYAVLSSAFFVRKSEKSFNNEIGLPLTILGCQNAWNNPFVWIKNIFSGLAVILLKNHYPKWMVLEVGADHPGDIEKIAKWLKPDIAVMTRFAKVPVHVEFFKSPQDIINEKKKLALYIKQNGLLIINNDDEDMRSIQTPGGVQIISYGFESGSGVAGSNEQIIYENSKPSGVAFRVDYAGTSAPVALTGVLGRQHIYPALAAIATGVSQKLNIVSMSQSLTEENAVQPGRMRILDGVKKSILIDDSYNSSPLAAEKAMLALGDLEINSDGRKVAALGDMMELGKYTVDEHKKLGRQAAQVCDMLITVGLRAKHIAEGALLGGMSEKNILQFEESGKAGLYLQNFIAEGDIILIKGSQAVRMEKITEEIMARPERKIELLARQDPEWLNR